MSPSLPSRVALRLLSALLLWIVGCSQPDPIREYTVRKPPAPGSLWFFKLIGPAEAVGAAAETLRQFVAATRFDEKTGLPHWTLPAGWTEETAPNSVRYKTLKLPGEAGLEVAVTQIGGQIPLAPEDERAQVNMLREQVGLPPVEAGAAPAEAAESLSVGTHRGKLYEFTGETPKFGPTRIVTAMVAVPTPPSAAIAGSDGKALPFTFTAPAEWQPAPPTQFSVVSMAASDGEETASMTITPALGGVLANYNRWRGQAGLPPVEEAELPEVLDPIEAGDLTLLFADVTGAKRAILGAVVPTSAGTWFVKLDGPPRLVKDETERFREFLKSFRAVK